MCISEVLETVNFFGTAARNFETVLAILDPFPRNNFYLLGKTQITNNKHKTISEHQTICSEEQK